jgi:hypothetical protein
VQFLRCPRWVPDVRSAGVVYVSGRHVDTKSAKKLRSFARLAGTNSIATLTLRSSIEHVKDGMSS